MAHHHLSSDRYRPCTPSTAERQFKYALRPAIIVETLFGRNLVNNSLILTIITKLFFLLIFTMMLIVFAIAVFYRHGIRLWIQFALYIIPLLTYLHGVRLFGSDGYYRLLSRNITDSFMVRFFVQNQNDSEELFEARPAAHNRSWLKIIAKKAVLFPMILEVIQWSGFSVFATNFEANSFIGNITETFTFRNGSTTISRHHVTQLTWNYSYYIFWILAVYLVGFVAYQFVFVSRIIVRDTVNFMVLFGQTSVLHIYPAKDHTRGFFARAIILITNFLTMDFLSSMKDECVYANCATLSRIEKRKPIDYKECGLVPSRVLQSPVKNIIENNKDNQEENTKISPKEALEIFSVFIAEIEEITSVFTPFTVTVAFFSLVNFATHIYLLARHDSHLNYWTLFRTFLFLLVALRMLLCVQHISNVLGKLPVHVKFIKCSGQLAHMDAVCPSWDDVLDVMKDFKLGERSFGFPLTLRQIASIATFMNVVFIITLSIFK